MSTTEPKTEKTQAKTAKPELKGDSEYDMAYEWVTKPLAKFFCGLLPFRVHPNTLTWTGLMLILISCYVVLTHDPDALNRWQWFALGVAIFTYNVLDSMDGIVARLEKIPSCEGEVMDHMIDAVCTLSPLVLGWSAQSTFLLTRRVLIAHFVFLLSHIYHRFHGGALVQGIHGFGVDATELISGVLCIVWSFYPGGAFGSGLLWFNTYGVDFLAWVGLAYFGFICIQTLVEKKCWQMLNPDLFMWIFYVITYYIWVPVFVDPKEFGFPFIALVFTMPLYFFRTLYMRLSVNPKNKTFATAHKSIFKVNGYTTKILFLLHVLTLIPHHTLQERRHALFMWQSFIAFSSTFATLINTHVHGPPLPKVRPANTPADHPYAQ